MKETNILTNKANYSNSSRIYSNYSKKILHWKSDVLSISNSEIFVLISCSVFFSLNVNSYPIAWNSYQEGAFIHITEAFAEETGNSVEVTVQPSENPYQENNDQDNGSNHCDPSVQSCSDNFLKCYEAWYGGLWADMICGGNETEAKESEEDIESLNDDDVDDYLDRVEEQDKIQYNDEGGSGGQNGNDGSGDSKGDSKDQDSGSSSENYQKYESMSDGEFRDFLNSNAEKWWKDLHNPKMKSDDRALPYFREGMSDAQKRIIENQVANYYRNPAEIRMLNDLKLMGDPLAGFAGGWSCVNCDPFTRSMWIQFGAGLGSILLNGAERPGDAGLSLPTPSRYDNPRTVGQDAPIYDNPPWYPLPWKPTLEPWYAGPKLNMSPQ